MTITFYIPMDQWARVEPGLKKLVPDQDLTKTFLLFQNCVRRVVVKVSLIPQEEGKEDLSPGVQLQFTLEVKNGEMSLGEPIWVSSDRVKTDKIETSQELLKYVFVQHLTKLSQL